MVWSRKQFRDDLGAEFSDASHLIWTAAAKNNAINQGVSGLWPECKNTKVDETQVLVADTFIYTPTGQPQELGYQQAFLEQESDEEYLLMRRFSQKREEVSGVGKWKIYVPEDIVEDHAGKYIRLHYHCQFTQYLVAYYTAATIAFVLATHKITDSANGLKGFKAGDTILVSGSAKNDGTYTVATGDNAGEIVVTEALAEDEAAGATIIIDDGNLKDVPYLPVFDYACLKLCQLMLQKAGSSDVRTWRDQIPEYRAMWLQSKKDHLVLSMARHIGFRRG